jgi:Protein of Unknown function (DUF2784)
VVFRVLADAAMLVHFAFLAFLAFGGFLAWRVPWVVGPHVAAVAWGVVSVAVGVDCPLTAAEDALRRRGGQVGLPHGFIDTYLGALVHPAGRGLVTQLAVATLVAVSWVGVIRARAGASSPGPAARTPPPPRR